MGAIANWLKLFSGSSPIVSAFNISISLYAQHLKSLFSSLVDLDRLHYMTTVVAECCHSRLILSKLSIRA